MRLKRLQVVSGLLVLSLALMASACGNGGAGSKENGANTPKAQEQNKDVIYVEEVVDIENNPVNYENFKALAMGASLVDATNTLGEGEKMEGLEGADVYYWRGNGLSNMTVTIKDGAIVEKTQSDLDGLLTEITAEQAAQITEGMTLEEVKGLLGEGALMRENTVSEEAVQQAYEWRNANGSNLTVLFENDAVISAVPISLS